MLSEVFWSFFLTSSIGCIIGIVKMLYKSKCKRCSFCGCEIIRDTEGELHEDEIELSKNNSNNNNNI